MKVLHISGAFTWGGNEQQLVNLINGLQKLNVENVIFCFKNTPIETYAKKNNLNYFSIQNVKLYTRQYTKSLYNYVKNNNIKIIHLHTSNSVTGFVVADILYRLKTPAVFSKKGISGSKSGLSAFKYNYKNIKKVICVSKIVKDAFSKTLKPKNHHKLTVVYDGIKAECLEHENKINLRKKYAIDSNKVLIGNIANHNRAKDLVTFVKTVNQLVNVKGITNVHFIQIGSKGKHSEEFIPLIKAYKLEEYITITGFLENASALINQWNICLITSEREGGPSSALEVVKHKVPIVSTTVGVMPELIEHKKNGFLSAVKDEKDLANNLEKLIENKPLQEQFKEQLYTIFLNKFTVTHLAKNTKTVYNEVLNYE